LGHPYQIGEIFYIGFAILFFIIFEKIGPIVGDGGILGSYHVGNTAGTATNIGAVGKTGKDAGLSAVPVMAEGTAGRYLL
jgi:hypothetical protein